MIQIIYDEIPNIENIYMEQFQYDTPMKKTTKVINLFAGPSGGKSATALELAGILKRKGISCEYVGERAKDLTWEENLLALNCQPAILGDQIARLHRIYGKVDFIVTDSPLLINLLHDGFGVTKLYKKYVVEIFNVFDNENILLVSDRDKRPHESEGRVETKERAKEMDKENAAILNDNKIKFVTFNLHENTAKNIFNYIAASFIRDPNVKAEETNEVIVTKEKGKSKIYKNGKLFGSQG